MTPQLYGKKLFIMVLTDLKKVNYNMHLIAGHPFGGTEVGRILDDALDTRGKMVRASLVLLCGAYGEKYEENKDKLYLLAAMVELIHLASLIHDDIVDESDFRRGKPSIQAKYHKDAAVYAGDFILSRVNYYEASENLNEASKILSKMIEGMCAGEIGQAVCRYKESTSVAEYLNNIRGKTVELFKGACKIGAMQTECSNEIISKLESFGENLGIMFQLRDDYLDFTSSESELGKTAHMDFREGIYTMPVLCALQNDKDGKLLAIMGKNAESSLNDEEIRKTEELVTELGGVDATIDEIRNCQNKIEKILGELPGCEATDMLWQLLKKLAI